MTMECGAARRLLLDGSPVKRFDASRASAERHAGKCPRCRVFASECEAGAELVKESLSAMPSVVLRERLFDAVAQARIRSSNRRRSRYVASAVIAASVAGLLLGYSLTSRPVFDSMLADIVADHGLAAADDHLESGDPIEIEAWLSARVAHAVMVPALAGGRVVGARICATPQGRGAVVEYEIDGRRVSYFMLPPPPGGAPNAGVKVAGTKGYSIAHWRDRGVVHAFVGALPSARVKELALECMEQAQPRSAARYDMRKATSFT